MDGVALEVKPELVKKKKKILGGADKDNFHGFKNQTGRFNRLNWKPVFDPVRFS
jgi:hypothetical protein